MSGLLVVRNGLVHVTRNRKAQGPIFNVIVVRIEIDPRRDEAKHIEPCDANCYSSHTEVLFYNERPEPRAIHVVVEPVGSVRIMFGASESASRV